MGDPAQKLETPGASGSPTPPDLSLVGPEAPQGAFFISDAKNDPNIAELVKLAEVEATTSTDLLLAVLKQTGIIEESQEVEKITDRISLMREYYRETYFIDGVLDVESVDREIFVPTEQFEVSGLIRAFSGIRRQFREQKSRSVPAHTQNTVREAEHVARLLMIDDIDRHA